MAEEILSPLRDYRLIYRDKFAKAAENAFQEFAAEANVDIEANRKTCEEIRHYQQKLDSIGKTLTWWWVLCIVLWIAGPLSLCLWLTDTTSIYIPLAIIVVIVLIEFLFVHRKISSLSKQRKDFKGNKEKLISRAYQQMEPLNRLYDSDIFRRLVNEVVPILHIDPYLKTVDMHILTNDMGLSETESINSAVIGLQSGKINGNPLLIRRRKGHFMGTKTYTGTKRVSVRANRIVNGKSESYTASETLRAHVTKPFPYYYIGTEVIYGNDAAPDLIFSRKKNAFKNKEGSLSYKYTHWKLRRQAAKMDIDFALMTNEEFEVLFTTTNRNNNHQYSLLFTPVAQANMTELIRDVEATGYGDDFDFHKNGKINMIVSEHMQSYDIYSQPAFLRQYQYDKAKQTFVSKNQESFRELYFALAPLLSIPLYQQMRPKNEIYSQLASDRQDSRCHYYEHEMLAYVWGDDQFKHPECVTNNILKTEAEYQPDGSTRVNVTAYGYRSVKRVEYQSVRASDGTRHTVEVEWDEYFPVEGHGHFFLKEMEQELTETTKLTPVQRQQRRTQILNSQPGSQLFHHFLTSLNPFR